MEPPSSHACFTWTIFGLMGGYRWTPQATTVVWVRQPTCRISVRLLVLKQKRSKESLWCWWAFPLFFINPSFLELPIPLRIPRTVYKPQFVSYGLSYWTRMVPANLPGTSNDNELDSTIGDLFFQESSPCYCPPPEASSPFLETATSRVAVYTDGRLRPSFPLRSHRAVRPPLAPLRAPAETYYYCLAQ